MKSQELPACPQCGSDKLYRDGLRYLRDGSSLQRWLCRCCGFRFSESLLKTGEKLNITKQTGAFQPCSNLAKDSVRHRDLAADKLLDNGSFSFGEDVESHTVTVVGKGLNNLRSHNCNYRVGVSEGEAKNLDIATEIQTVAGESKTTQLDLKGFITVYMAKASQQGLAETTVKRRVYTLETLAKKKANLNDPLSVWQIVENEKNWVNSTKTLVATAYKNFCQIFKINIPSDLNSNKWLTTERVPFVPSEIEVNELIAGCNPKTSSFLQLLKETGIRSGEAWQLRWLDFDFERKILTLNCVEKKGKPRQFRTSDKLIAMLQRIRKEKETVWHGNVNNFRISFAAQKRRLALKLQNPRIKMIALHTLRHFYACKLYHQTKDILLVQERLGHRSILNTMVYTQLVDWESDDYATATATTVDEAKRLAEAGWGKWDIIDGVHIYRKRK
jgi:integrase/recombinase XerD